MLGNQTNDMSYQEWVLVLVLVWMDETPLLRSKQWTTPKSKVVEKTTLEELL